MKRKFNKTSIISLLVILSIFISGCSALKNINSPNNLIKDNNQKIENNIDNLINQIEVKKGQEKEYDRNTYTSKSQSYNFNGKKYNSIRNYSYFASVWYSNGVYKDPYNGKNITNVKAADYDHIIPLHYANLHGADSWTNEKRKKYADDPSVGVVVNAHDNRAKGDKGPSKWLPKNNVKEYCYTWLVIAKKYNLSIASEDMKVIKEKLKNTKNLSIINEYN